MKTLISLTFILISMFSWTQEGFDTSYNLYLLQEWDLAYIIKQSEADKILDTFDLYFEGLPAKQKIIFDKDSIEQILTPLNTSIGQKELRKKNKWFYHDSRGAKWLEFAGDTKGLELPEMIKEISKERLILYYDNDIGHFEFIYYSVK